MKSLKCLYFFNSDSTIWKIQNEILKMNVPAGQRAAQILLTICETYVSSTQDNGMDQPEQF